MISSLLRTARNTYVKSRKCKVYVPKFYEAIPHHYKPIFIDIHDSYKPRSKEEIKKELDGLQYSYEVEMALFPNDANREIKQRKVVVKIDIRPFQFTKMQLDRLKLIMGARYKDDASIQKIVVERFQTFEENLVKAEEIIYELIVEAKRAP